MVQTRLNETRNIHLYLRKGPGPVYRDCGFVRVIGAPLMPDVGETFKVELHEREVTLEAEGIDWPLPKMQFSHSMPHVWAVEVSE